MGRILLFLLPILICSCVPLREIKYLQDTKGELELDSLGYIIENETPYYLQVDDILVMNVVSRDPSVASFFGQENTGLIRSANEGVFYISGLSVDDRGFIEVPSLGSFNVLGKTLEEVSSEVESKMYKIYQSDAVFVKLKLTGINYTILGEVGRPGQYVVYRNRLDILEAVARSGDLNVVANRKKIRLIRKYPEGRKMFELDITKDNILNSEFFFLHPNDIVIVNPKVQRTIGTGTNLVGTIGATATALGSLFAIIAIVDRFSE